MGEYWAESPAIRAQHTEFLPFSRRTSLSFPTYRCVIPMNDRMMRRVRAGRPVWDRPQPRQLSAGRARICELQRPLRL